MNLLCCQVKPVSSVNHQASVIPRALSLCFQNLKLVKHKDNLSALEVDKKKCKNEGKKKTSLFFFFFCKSLHIWSLGTKKIQRTMAVLMGLSQCTGKPTHLRGDGEHLSSYFMKMQECGV